MRFETNIEFDEIFRQMANGNNKLYVRSANSFNVGSMWEVEMDFKMQYHPSILRKRSVHSENNALRISFMLPVTSWNFKTYKFSLDSSNEKLKIFNFIDLSSSRILTGLGAES